MNEKRKFSVDWLSIRLDGLNSPVDFCLEFEKVFPGVEIMQRPAGGINFYRNAYYVPAAGHSSILFCWNEDDNGDYLKEHIDSVPHGLFISVSGDGCRYLNSLKKDGLRAFCSLCSLYEYNVTRIDVACDFLDSDNGVVPMIQLWASQYYLDCDKEYGLSCNMKKEGLVSKHYVYDRELKQETFNITVGSRDSRKGVMQLYNKKVEMENGRLSDIKDRTFQEYGVTDYWWRLEYRCKSFSEAVFQNLLKGGIIAAYLSAMDNFGRFYVPYYDDAHCSMDMTAPSWSEFELELTEYLAQFGEEAELIELVSQPYIPADVTRIQKYSDRMSSFLYKFAMLSAVNPSWYKRILSEGQKKFLENPRNLAFRNELRSDYGFDVFPEVDIFIPEVCQVNIEV